MSETILPIAGDPPPTEPSHRGMVTAGLVIIGDEILTGRTKDANLAWLAQHLGRIGIRLMEVRVVPDCEADIVAAVNAMRQRWRYLFTTGGIGPTHDDITAASIAKAFGVPVRRHPEAVRLLEERIGKDRMNEARLKMADVPEGGELIVNEASGAPGFRVGNVFVLAGVPSIMQAMVDALTPWLEGGAAMQADTVASSLPEGALAEALTAIQARFGEQVEIGSYPWFRDGKAGVNLVLRGTDAALIEEAKQAVEAMLEALGDSSP